MPGNPRYALDRVSADVLDEISKELEEGRVAAVEQVKLSLQQARAEASKVLEAGNRQSESVRRQILGAAELEARNGTLRAIDEASNRIFEGALERAAKGSAEYERSLERMVEKGVEVIGKEAVVECNTRDKKVVGSVIKSLNTKNGCKLTLGDKPIETVGGVVLTSKDGSMRFDNTLEARLERMKPQLRREIARVIGSTTG